MYAITGVTGHVGAATAEALLGQGAMVRAVVRDPDRSQPWTARGAQTAIADFHDPVRLAAALRGTEGAFVMLPTLATAHDAEHRRMAETIAAAVEDSGVPHVVMLSSIGAELAEGTGPIRWLHHLENQLARTGAVVTTIRSCHFQEKVETVLGAAVGAGVYPVFADTADVPTQMVATRDIGAVAAAALQAPPPASEVIDLEAPEYSEREVAEHLAAALGKPLQVVTIPQAGWIDAMRDAGLSAAFAHELAALYEAEQRGLFQLRGDRRHACATPIEQTLRRIVQGAVSRSSVAS